MSPQALVALAGFVRDRLAEMTTTLAPSWPIRTPFAGARPAPVRQFATAVVGAAAPFASTSYARARLLRQMHAAGLLSATEVDRTVAALGAAGASEAD